MCVAGTLTGHTVLTAVLYSGPQDEATIKLLLNAGANIENSNDAGANALLCACANDCRCEEVLDLVLDQCPHLLNQRQKPRTLKWRAVFKLCRLAVRLGFVGPAVAQALRP